MAPKELCLLCFRVIEASRPMQSRPWTRCRRLSGSQSLLCCLPENRLTLELDELGALCGVRSESGVGDILVECEDPGAVQVEFWCLAF